MSTGQQTLAVQSIMTTTTEASDTLWTGHYCTFDSVTGSFLCIHIRVSQCLWRWMNIAEGTQDSLTLAYVWDVDWEVSPRHLLLPRQPLKTFANESRLPLCSSSLLHVGHDDTVRRAFGPSPACDLDTQSVLTLHHVHLPDLAALTGLWMRRGEYSSVWRNNQECALLNTRYTVPKLL